MSPGVHHGERVQELVRLAARWRLAGLLFRRPRPGWQQEIEALTAETGDTNLVAAASLVGDMTEGSYLALLGSGGPVSPREVSYRPLQDPGRLLAEISAFFQAFAYRAEGEDPADHVAVAADFVGFLMLKEAYARAVGRLEDAETTCAARADFTSRHVAETVRGMARRLRGVPQPPEFLAAALTGLSGLAGVDLDVEEREPATPFLRAGLDDATFSCGTPDECRDLCASPHAWPSPGLHEP